ncbi:MAG: hypothetical protein K2N26_08870 [Oscillospiraceae bacterium]|nr:hypothetical protein [Oscillospiraceae bacterium]
MRVTNNITTRQFLTNNNMLLTRRLQSENRIATQRRFNRVSEDTINGSKAMVIRRQLRDLDMYNDNLGSAKAIFNAAETNLTSIAHDNYISVEERLVASSNGTWSQEELDTFATELEEIADEMVKTLNADFSERQLFGGASNQKAPFLIERVRITDEGGNVVFPPDYYKYYNEDGSMKDDITLSDIPRTVTYNGIPLDFDVTSDMILPDGTVSKAAGSYTVTVLDEKTKTFKDNEDDNRIISAEAVERAQSEKDNSVLYPGSKPIYVDIGLGIKYNDDLTVDPQTALDVSINGAKTTGSGVDISRVPITGSSTGTVTDAMANDMAAGYAAGAGNVPLSLTVNGKQYDLELDLSETLPAKTDGTTYTDDQISSALNKALKDAYKAAAKKSLPSGVSLSYSNKEITLNSGSTDIEVGANGFNITQGPIERKVETQYETISESYENSFNTAAFEQGLAAGDLTKSLTVNVNGTDYTLALDLSALDSSKLTGTKTSFTKDEVVEAVSSALDKALKDANPALPSGVTIGCSNNGTIVMKADLGFTAEISAPNDLGLPAGSASTEIDDSSPQIPVITERYSKNLMQLVLDAASALRRGDQSTVNAIIDRANEANNHILTEITTLGTKYNSIEFYQNKNKDYEYNLKERQNLVEGTDMENEIITWEAVKAAYDATLKIGTQVLPHSIFDFI